MLLILGPMEWLLAFIGGFGGIIGLAGAIVVFWKNGGNSANEKTINALKELNDAQAKNYEQKLDLMVKSNNEWQERTKKCEELHRDNLEKTGKMQGSLESMQKVIENRNPELTIVLGEIKDFMKLTYAYIQKVA